MTTDKDVVSRVAIGRFQNNLFGRKTNFFGCGRVSEVLGIKLPEAPTPEFAQLTDKQLDAARLRGDQLIWFPAIDIEGEPITMKRLVSIFKNEAPMGGKILRYPNGYQNRKEFTTDTARTGKSALGSWRLVGTKSIPGTDEDYLRQTIVAAKFVAKKVFLGNVPKNLKPILTEPAKQKEQILKLLDGDKWKEAAKILANLPFNQQFRGTLIELLIQVILNQKLNCILFLENESAWVSALWSDCPVSFGYVDNHGTRLSDWPPYNGYNDIRFFLSVGEDMESES